MTNFENLIDSLPDVVLVVNEAGEITFVGGRSARLLGYEPAELIGSPVELLVPSRFSAHREKRLSYHAAPSVRSMSTRPVLNARHKSGAEVPVDISLSPLRQPDGSGTLVIAAIRDASQRSAMEQRTQIQSVALQAAANGIVITDRDGIIMWANEAATNLTGYATPELVGQHTRILKSGHHDESFYRELWQTVLHGGTWFGEVVNRRKDGALYREEQTITPVVNASGQITHFIAIKQDVTARWRAEEALRETNEALSRARTEAEAATRAKSMFLSSMSHELRTPLNAILGYAQILDRGSSLSPVQREYIEAIRRSGEHLLGLINDVLSISRIEAGQIVLTESAFELPALLREVGRMMRFRVEEKRLRLSVEVAPDVPEVTYGDENKLRQILVNLVGNAVKFTEAGGIAIRGQWNAGWVRVEVEDTGIGISPQDIQSLFEPFVQTESGRRSKEGTGLGLAISRSLARAMGGEVVASSELGRGTTFVLSIPLPVADRSQLKPRPPRVVGLEAGQPDFRILVADDIADNRNVLSALLAPLGFSIREAANGIEAINLWESWHPHLILMDLRMSVMDGIEATRRIRQAEAGRDVAPTGIDRCRIVAVTAGAFAEERTALFESGCDDYIVKPFHHTAIFEHLVRHLGVKFVVEQPDARMDQTANRVETTMDPRRMQSLPGTLRDQLRDMTMQGDWSAVNQVANEIQNHDEALGQAIRIMARGYAADEILDLLGD